MRPMTASRATRTCDARCSQTTTPGARCQIAQTVFESFAPQLDLSFATAIYGLAGLFLGSLIGERATAAFLSRQTRAAI